MTKPYICVTRPKASAGQGIGKVAFNGVKSVVGTPNSSFKADGYAAV